MHWLLYFGVSAMDKNNNIFEKIFISIGGMIVFMFCALACTIIAYFF